MINRILTFVCLFICLHTITLTAMDDPIKKVNNLMEILPNNVSLLSSVWGAVNALGNSALWTYENPKKAAAASCAVTASGAYSVYKMNNYFSRQGKRTAKLIGGIGGITAGGYLLYKYASDTELKRCLKAGINTVLVTMATYQQQLLDGHAEIKNINERNREQASQESLALANRLDLLLNERNIDRPRDVLDNQLVQQPVHEAPRIEPVVFEPDSANSDDTSSLNDYYGDSYGNSPSLFI